MKKKFSKSLKFKAVKVANLTIVNSLTGGSENSEDPNCGTGSDTKNKSVIIRNCPISGKPDCTVLDTKDDNCPGG